MKYKTKMPIIHYLNIKYYFISCAINLIVNRIKVRNHSEKEWRTGSKLWVQTISDSQHPGMIHPHKDMFSTSEIYKD